MKKTLLYTLLIFVLVGLIFTFKPSPKTLTTDSGWDTSYDSGGSDWSSSDSSWSSSYDYDYSSSSGSSKPITEMTFYDFIFDEIFVSIFMVIYFYAFIFIKGNDRLLKSILLNFLRACIFVSLETFISPYFLIINMLSIFIFPFILIALTNRLGLETGTDLEKYSNYKDLDPKELEKYNLNLDEIKEETYKIFIDVQNAWMEFDYDALSNLCSDELYNSYKRELEVLKLKNGKNIMDSFNKQDIKVLSITEIDNKLTIKVYLHVKFHDYVINTTNNKVIRGNKNIIINNHYLLEYIKLDKKIDKCPSCGAKIKDSSNQKCEHCGNTIVNNSNKFVLAHKRKV